MKKLIIFIATFMMVSSIQAAEKLDLEDITSRCFTASYVSGVNPIEGTDLYASISNDGSQIVSYSFKTGKQVTVLFDAAACKAPFESVDGYELSPDGKRMLILTKRRVFTVVLLQQSISFTTLPASLCSSCRMERTSRWLHGHQTPAMWLL